MNTLHRYTERERQIAAAALEYADEICKKIDKYNISDQEMIGLAFLTGGMLVDNNPRRGLVKIEDVRDIYSMWLDEYNDNSGFLEYFTKYCDKEGWL